MNKKIRKTLQDGSFHKHIVYGFEGISTSKLREMLFAEIEQIKKLLNECPDFILEENRIGICGYLNFVNHDLDVNSYYNAQLLEEGEENVRKRRNAVLGILNGTRAPTYRRREAN